MKGTKHQPIDLLSRKKYSEKVEFTEAESYSLGREREEMGQGLSCGEAVV